MRARVNQSIAVARILQGYPLPLQGYFGSKVLVMSSLQGIGVGKIFITNGLLLKYLLSMN
jgi:hypothetical protein